MKPGITHLVLPDLPLEEFFRTARGAGYECVELAMRPTGELTPQTSGADLRRIVESAQRIGVTPTSMCHLHLSGNLLDSGDAQRRGIDETIAGLRAASVMGIDCTLHTLGRLSPTLYYDDGYRNAVVAMKELSHACAKHRVSIAIEFVWSGFLFSPVEMKRFLDEIASPWIGFYFDPGNMAIFQYPQHWARILAKYIKRAHLKDFNGDVMHPAWPALLTGKVDFPAVMRELRAAGYDGPLVSEVSTQAASIAETAEAIRKIAAMG